MVFTLTSQSDNNEDCSYAAYLKPYLSQLFKAAGLDVQYERAEGDHLYYTNRLGEEVAVLDLLGGFGASLVGHNHPQLIERAIKLLQSQLPFNAQASNRSQAGHLAERLMNRMKRETGLEYMATLSNSGAEVIEAAIKHAELERVENIEALIQKQKIASKNILKRIKSMQCVDLHAAVRTLCYEVKKIAGINVDDERDDIKTMTKLVEAVAQFNAQQLNQPSLFMALEGAFHGKTTGALQLTYNEEFRAPWGSLGIETEFLPLNDIDAAMHRVDAHQFEIFSLSMDDEGRIKLMPKMLNRVAAIFIEPIQGEGGVYPLDVQFAQQLRALSDKYHFPLVIDEIQTMGRTGRFLASSRLGVNGDYYTFSKALGGGLAKVSALMIARDRYIKKFGYLHTSTFAEDDFSSAMGSTLLALLEEDQDHLIEVCAQKGNYFKSKLNQLMSDYPTVITAVRGHGLMLGIEIAEQSSNPSPWVRTVDEQSLLGFILCGCLLNRFNIRVAPTLSSSRTIRLEPSAYISQD